MNLEPSLGGYWPYKTRSGNNQWCSNKVNELNYTCYITEPDTIPITQQLHGDRKM